MQLTAEQFVSRLDALATPVRMGEIFKLAGEFVDRPIAEILVNDDEEFVNKAVGGLLRKAGKKNRTKLIAFLDRQAAPAPRVTLRFAIEHLDPDLRQHYLGQRRATRGSAD